MKEKKPGRTGLKEKVQATPKQFLRRGLDDGTERLRGQLRDASQRGQRDSYGGDQIEDTTWSGTRWGMRGIEKLLKAKKNGRNHTPEVESSPDADIPKADWPEPSPTEPSTPRSGSDYVRVKTWEAVSDFSEVHPSANKQSREPSAAAKTTPDISGQSHTDTPKIKTREAVQWDIPHASSDAVPISRERPSVSDSLPQIKQIKTQEAPLVSQYSKVSTLRQREELRSLPPREKAPSALVEHIESPRQSYPDIKTKDSYIFRQTLDSPEKSSRMSDLGSRMKAWYAQLRRPAKEMSQALDQGSEPKEVPIRWRTSGSPKRDAKIPTLEHRIKGRSIQQQPFAEESLQMLDQGTRTKEVRQQSAMTSAEKRKQLHGQGGQEFMQEQGRQEAMKQAKLRHSKKNRASSTKISSSETPSSRAGDGPASFAQQSSVTLPTQHQSSPAPADGRVEKAITKGVRNSVSKGKNTAKTASAGIKSPGHAAHRTVKTTERSAKAMQKAKATAKAPQRAVEAARATAKTGATVAKDVGKATLSALRKAVAAARELAAAIMAGGWVVAVITLIICITGLLVTSPFGLFFSDPGSGMTIPEATAQLNGEFTAQIEQIKTDNPYDTLDFDEAGIALVTDNWSNVLAVYSVRVSSGEGTGASVLSSENLAILRETFWDMNQITYSTETVEHEGEDTETILHISITTKTPQQIAAEYGFTEEQNQLLEEMLKPEYQDLFQSLVGSGQSLTFSDEEIQEIVSRLPGGLSEERRQVVLTAYQLLGKVNYFWGGKSLVLGWDSRWGTPKQVWAAGSPSTGTVRPYGLDCSGFVDWVFYNVSGGTYVIGHGGGAHMQHTYCTPISWAQAQPGDLVFYPNDTHVGIVCGFDSGDNVQIIHCASGSNNVVVTGKNGFKTIARPQYYS